MAKSNKLNGKNVAGAVGIAAVAVEALTPVIEKVIDKLTDKPTDSSQEKSDEPSSVVVPTLYGKGILLRLEEAIEILNNYGLKAKPSESPLPKGNTAYKDYVNSQVIDSFPKSKELTPPGSTVVLYYVTQAVIDESQRLFDEAAKHKVEAKRKKAEEHIRQKERTRQMIIDATDKAKAQFSKVLPGESKKSLNKKSKQ